MSRILRLIVGACIMATVAAWPSRASAGPIVVDAGWYGFCFGGVGSAATAGCQNEGIATTGNSFTFVTATSVELKVTDAFQHGDQFDVFVNAVLAFTTSLVAVNIVSTTGNPDLAFADPTYSSGSIILGPGAYSVDVFTAASPFGGGGAYLEVQQAQAVPEPASLLLFGSGLAALRYRRRRQARKQIVA